MDNYDIFQIWEIQPTLNEFGLTAASYSGALLPRNNCVIVFEVSLFRVLTHTRQTKLDPFRQKHTSAAEAQAQAKAQAIAKHCMYA